MEVQELWVDQKLISVRWGKDNERACFLMDGKERPDVASLPGNGALLLQIAASSNNAHSLSVGDPTEIGLLKISKCFGVERLPILEEDVPFTSEKKYMMTTHNRVTLSSPASSLDMPVAALQATR